MGDKHVNDLTYVSTSLTSVPDLYNTNSAFEDIWSEFDHQNNMLPTPVVQDFNKLNSSENGINRYFGANPASLTREVNSCEHVSNTPFRGNPPYFTQLNSVEHTSNASFGRNSCSEWDHQNSMLPTPVVQDFNKPSSWENESNPYFGGNSASIVTREVNSCEHVTNIGNSPSFTSDINSQEDVSYAYFGENSCCEWDHQNSMLPTPVVQDFNKVSSWEQESNTYFGGNIASVVTTEVNSCEHVSNKILRGNSPSFTSEFNSLDHVGNASFGRNYCSEWDHQNSMLPTPVVQDFNNVSSWEHGSNPYFGGNSASIVTREVNSCEHVTNTGNSPSFTSDVNSQENVSHASFGENCCSEWDHQNSMLPTPVVQDFNKVSSWEHGRNPYFGGNSASVITREVNSCEHVSNTPLRGNSPSFTSEVNSQEHVSKALFVQDFNNVSSWEHGSNTYFGENSASVPRGILLGISNTPEPVAWIPPDEIEWLRTLDQWKGEEQTKDNILPETHLSFEGVADGIDMNGSFHLCENIPKNDQDIALDDKGKTLATEGTSLGGADDNQTINPGENSRKSFQRYSTTAVLTLRNFFDHKTPYPDCRQLYKLSKLSELSGLTTKQINTWFSNERERKRKRGKGTSSVDVRFKTRIKHPDAAVNVFKAWVDTHPKFARPTKEEQLELAEEAKLESQQVSYWFENDRKKKRKRALKLHNDQLVDTEVTKARQGTPEFGAQETGENAVVQQTEHEFQPAEFGAQETSENAVVQQMGHEFEQGIEPLQEEISNDDKDDDWDEELWD